MIYVCSDIHAQGEKFNQFYQSLQAEDEVYVIGDAIDKGDDRLGPLLKIKNDSRFHMMIGNHEDMMLNYYKARAKYLKDSSCHDDYINEEFQWLILNDGYGTMKALEKQGIEQEIVDWLSQLPIVLNVECNGRKFLLAHSKPISEEDLYYNEATEDQIHEVVWTRFRDGKYPSSFNKIILAGHTIRPEIFYVGDNLQNASYVDLDCGCAMGQEGRLCVLCLNDLSYRYFK